MSNGGRMRGFVRDLVRSGLSVERQSTGGHYIVRDASGQYLTTVPCTPRDVGNAERTARQRLRRKGVQLNG